MTELDKNVPKFTCTSSERIQQVAEEVRQHNHRENLKCYFEFALRYVSLFVTWVSVIMAALCACSRWCQYESCLCGMFLDKAYTLLVGSTTLDSCLNVGLCFAVAYAYYFSHSVKAA